MRHVPRLIEGVLNRALRAFPAVVLTGPRRSGKTWLLRHLLPKAQYFLLEDPDIIARLRSDPRGFLDELRPPVILDEIQNVPEILQWVRTRIDRTPRRTGQWLLTGSQDAPWMHGVSESLAGRAAVFQLLPLALAETNRASLFRGGYPEVLARPGAAKVWFSSYLQTYLERDVRAITTVRDLAQFRRFLALIASRHGQILNKTDIAAPMGVSVPTITQWLGVLEITGQILLIPPFYSNVGKRLIKSSRIYLSDSGLACHLLNIESVRDLKASTFRGPLFEGMVAAEIVKSQINRGLRRELYHFRDEQGLEVDFVYPGRNGRIHLVECKSGGTATPDMATSMIRLATAFKKSEPRRKIEMTLVHGSTARRANTRVLAPGVQAITLPEFVDRLNA